MLSVEDIKEYLADTELEGIISFDTLTTDKDGAIRDAISDATIELKPIYATLDDDMVDLYTKRLTICILLTRANVNLDSVELPFSECSFIRGLVAKSLNSKNSLTASGKEAIFLVSNSNTNKTGLEDF